jgi:hypothetical protein
MTRLLTALSIVMCVVMTEANAQAPGYHFNGKELFQSCTSGQDNAAYLSSATSESALRGTAAAPPVSWRGSH